MTQAPTSSQTVVLLRVLMIPFSDQVKNVLDKFLDNSREFYLELAVTLQATYGDVGFRSGSEEAVLDTAAFSQLPAVGTGLDCRISVYRCLICLGDLSRYKLWILLFCELSPLGYIELSLEILL